MIILNHLVRQHDQHRRFRHPRDILGKSLSKHCGTRTAGFALLTLLTLATFCISRECVARLLLTFRAVLAVILLAFVRALSLWQAVEHHQSPLTEERHRIAQRT